MALQQPAEYLPFKKLTLPQLRDARERRQVDVARAMGVKPSSVAHLEGESNPKINTLARYLDAIGVELVLVVVAKKPDGLLDRQVLRLPGDGQNQVTIDDIINGTWRPFAPSAKSGVR